MSNCHFVAVSVILMKNINLLIIICDFCDNLKLIRLGRTLYFTCNLTLSIENVFLIVATW